MKKIIGLSLLILVLAGLLPGPAFATEMKSAPSGPAGIWVKIYIIFHKPKNDCKTGFGFCTDLTWGIDGPSGGAKYCPVRAQVNSQNQLIIEVTEEALVSYEGGSSLPDFRNRTSVTLDDPYTFSAATSKALGSLTPITVKAGTYPLSYANHIYTLTIQL